MERKRKRKQTSRIKSEYQCGNGHRWSGLSHSTLFHGISLVRTCFCASMHQASFASEYEEKIVVTTLEVFSFSVGGHMRAPRSLYLDILFVTQFLFFSSISSLNLIFPITIMTSNQIRGRIFREAQKSHVRWRLRMPVCICPSFWTSEI